MFCECRGFYYLIINMYNFCCFLVVSLQTKRLLKQTNILFHIDYVVVNNVFHVPVIHKMTNELFFSPLNYVPIKGELSDSFTNYNYVGNTKVSVSIKKNLYQQMHIKRDISN